MGVLFLAVFIIAVGLVGTNFIGKKVVAIGEGILNKIPVVRVIYTSIKKVVDTLSLIRNTQLSKDGSHYLPKGALKNFGNSLL